MRLCFFALMAVRPRRVVLYKNPIDEIVDALDSMLGVPDLTETDLKQGVLDEKTLTAAQQRKKQPPADALEKPSVAIFFLLLGTLPLGLALALGLQLPFKL